MICDASRFNEDAYSLWKLNAKRLTKPFVVLDHSLAPAVWTGCSVVPGTRLTPGLADRFFLAARTGRTDSKPSVKFRSRLRAEVRSEIDTGMCGVTSRESLSHRWSTVLAREVPRWN